ERTYDTALDKRPEAVDVVRVDLPAHILAASVRDIMVREVLVQALVTDRLVGGDQLHVRSNGLPDKALQRRRVGVVDNAANHVALALDSADHRDLVDGAAPALAALHPAANTTTVPVLRLATDVGFVNLDGARQLDELLVPHCGADAVAHVPSGAVGAGPDHPVDLEGANPLLRLDHEVDNLEPHLEGNVGV